MGKNKKNRSERLLAQKPSDVGKVEAPKAEAPKAEAPKAEAPKAEAPKAEAPKAEAPKAEAPKAEPARTEKARPRLLQYGDPGLERKLPAPVAIRLSGGERVKLKKTQEYADGAVVREGEVGWTLNPSSQAASWSVNFAKAGGGSPRVVPEWLLERVDPAPAHH